MPQDYAEAIYWYRKAADQGIPDAQFWLGRMYSEGRGVTQDYVEAFRWYRKAASRLPLTAREARALLFGRKLESTRTHKLGSSDCKRGRRIYTVSGQESITEILA